MKTRIIFLRLVAYWIMLAVFAYLLIHQNGLVSRTLESENQKEKSNTTTDSLTAVPETTIRILHEQVEFSGCPFDWPSQHIDASGFRMLNYESYVYSAFYDNRSSPAVIRVVGLSDNVTRYSPPLCVVWYSKTDCDVVRATIKKVEMRNNLKNPSSIYLCLTQREDTPSHISLADGMLSRMEATLPVRNTAPHDGAKFNFIVCIHEAFYGCYPPSRILVEFIEVYRMLGADKIILYNATSSCGLKSVMARYTKDRVLELHQWRLPVHVKTHAFAQTALINDCIYRYMHATRYLALVNVDEFLIPRKHNTLIDLLDKGHCNGAGEQLFQNAIFSLNSPISTQLVNNETLTRLQSIVLAYTARSEVWGSDARAKCVVQPHQVIAGQIHGGSSLMFGSDSCVIPDSESLSHHYRKRSLDPRNSTVDNIIGKFKDSIVQRLNEALCVGFEE